MTIINDLINGFGTALTLNNLLFCLIGVTLGTLIGVLPGLGPTAGIAVLIPLSAGLDPTTAIIMLAGIYYGSMYGSSTSAILINTPGQGAAVLTAVEGFELAKQGRAGPALGMSAIASFVGGTISLFGLIFLAPVLANLALGFGPSEYFALMVFGMTIVVSLSGTSLVKGLISAFIGLLV
ncbi:MAG TPA: tripartite tricarboxylate transporter permease, partial [Tissierellaceae bacterium]|nr:tripartite tricarboxylate transporter permease [Tissierellaceae bacterium]